MLDFLRRRWFLVCLLTLIPVGLMAGMWLPEASRKVIDSLRQSSLKTWIIAAVLFFMSVTLDGARLKSSLVKPGPVAWAFLVNAVLMPCAAWPMMRWQLSRDFAVGLMIAASVPCTMAAASVWTRRAGGNDAISLLVTILTNGLCFAYTPFWLALFTASEIELDRAAMMQRLLITALVPIAAGQLVRWLPGCGKRADRMKTGLGVAAQLGILIIVAIASFDAGGRLNSESATNGNGPSLAALTVVVASCLGLHLAAMGIALLGAKLWGFLREDLIGVAFSSSQKTLPIGVYIATHEKMFGAEFEWAVFPMIIFHASQLFVDTTIADRFRRDSPSENPTETPAARTVETSEARE